MKIKVTSFVTFLFLLTTFRLPMPGGRYLPEEGVPTAIVEIDTGKGADCFSSSRLCLVEPLESIASRPGATSDGIGLAYLNTKGHFVLEIQIVLTDALQLELSDGYFELKEGFSLSVGLLTALGKEKKLYKLKPGNYAIIDLGSRYRIVF